MGFVNEPEAILSLRRNRRILAVCGRGVMIFGLWSLVKLLMYFFLFEDYFQMSSYSAFLKMLLIIVIGSICIVIPVASLFTGENISILIYAFVVTIITSGIEKIINAFKKTAVLYIP